MSVLRYPIPAARYRGEMEEKRSRFIASVAPIATVEEARAFIETIRQEFPDARHNCWAFLVGTPGSTDRVGCSDDGEPSGTAGKPMLQALIHSGFGDLVVVVSRYFGGIKLGTGGLVRAYGHSVQQALNQMPRGERIDWRSLNLVFDYSLLDGLKRELDRFEVELLQETFTDQVSWQLRLPAELEEVFRRWVVDLSHGRIECRSIDPPG